MTKLESMMRRLRQPYKRKSIIWVNVEAIPKVSIDKIIDMWKSTGFMFYYANELPGFKPPVWMGLPMKSTYRKRI